jgi:nucleoside-diphosphate-sugar epimerase
MTTNRILLTGATGYVGGTVLDHLISNQKPSIKGLTFDLLVRTEEAADKLRAAYGDRVNPIQWPGGLSNVSFIADTAAEYDLIVNTGSGFVAEGAKAFVDGLARRVKRGQSAPWLLQISGCTNLGDRPLTQKADPDRVLDDADGAAVYEFLRREDEADPYPQRTTEVGVLTSAAEKGVQAVSLNTPLIFGEGTGLFNKQGIIIPTLMRYVVQHGYGFKLNETANFDWVHVKDLADVFNLLVETIMERQDRGVGYIPSGKSGVIFPAVGRVLQTEIFQLCLDACFDLGVLPREDTPKEKEIRHVSLQEIADEITFGFVPMAERGWAGNKAQNGTVAKQLLGWEPKFLEEAWKKDFVDELKALRDGRRGVTMDSCIANN